MVAITLSTWRVVEGHVASCGYSDEDQTAHLKEEVDPHRGYVPTNHAQRGRIMTAQSSFNESDDVNFS